MVLRCEEVGGRFNAPPPVTASAEAAQPGRDHPGPAVAAVELFSQRLEQLIGTMEQKHRHRGAVEQKLSQIQSDNATRLEEMRRTVDEKLQGTLEKGLGDSFKQVSERLEQVYRGLGEMQPLASGVGGLEAGADQRQDPRHLGRDRPGQPGQQILNRTSSPSTLPRGRGATTGWSMR